MKKILFIALTLLGVVTMQAQTYPVNLPKAETMYDFSGNGLKQAVVINTTETEGYDWRTYFDCTLTLSVTGDVTEQFASGEQLASINWQNVQYEQEVYHSGYVTYIEDVNSDGKPDISTDKELWMSSPTTHTLLTEAMAMTNMDINRDGRKDYLVLNQSVRLGNTTYAYYGDIAYQLPDGSFQSETMQVMTWDEFVAQMTPEELDMYNNPQNYSLGEVSRFSYGATWGGWSLARAPRRNATTPQKAPGIGYTINAPTKAIDLNGDGLVDLIDEKNGIIYINMDNGKWVWSMTNGLVIPADLNNDGIMDFVFPGAKLYVAVYNKATAQFDISTLYQNTAVDDIVYCYDFDHDGDLDLLATFTASNNATGYAYTCFFTNNGNGTFKKKAEADYGENELTFSALQDINGDGWYDLLAFNKTGENQYGENLYELVWLQGKSNLTFEDPQTLGSFTANRYDQLKYVTINAEDLDGDGKMEIWISGANTGSTQIYKLNTATANTRPTAPAAPTLAYNNGFLTVTWGNGSDAETQTADLTYALRIGTTTGGNEILAAHANADGSRRNFLDGNMGKNHTYTIDLRSYSPATVYVAVQTLDAQHSGSVWSQEATVVHDLVPVEFTLGKTSIAFNETVELTYTALPEGYTHQWTIEDGSYVVSTESDTKLILSFTSGGTKTVTHTVTTPNGGTLTAGATIQVMPAGIGEAIELSEETLALFNYPMADYNYDGRLDGFNGQTVQTGTDNGNIFRKAAGLWNTNITGGAPIWLDWNLDGHVDLLFRNAWLAHESDGYSLTAEEENEDIQEFYDAHWQPSQQAEYVITDIDNNGYLDSLALIVNSLAGRNEYGDEIYGAYAWYKGADGIIAEGFLLPDAGNTYYIADYYLTPDEHYLLARNKLYPIVAQADVRPAAPTDVQATMTDEGLLITWTAAVDDHTPTANMRYNLSVKQQGAETYLISPQNGGEEDAAYLPGYSYIDATRYLIPTSALGSGRYEIALQAIDRQNKLSVFSQTITATVTRNPIEVQAFACADEDVVVSYRGEESTGNPVWNFDGGNVVEESGFGPYTVVWTTGGEKTVTLTLDGQTWTSTITIDDPKALDVILPTVLYEGTTATASVPDGIVYEWFAQINGGGIHPIDETGVILNMDEHHEYISSVVSYDKRLRVRGLNVTAYYVQERTDKTLTDDDVVLYLKVTNENGCSTFISGNVTVLAATAIPTLTFVTTDANGHNVISWTNAEAFATVNVYKEGASLNDFQLIGSANAAAGTYTDNASDATQKAERYQLTGVMANGNESPASTIHKTVHLTISRGVQNGTFNLIWNEYAGANVASYNILRGATPTSLSQIAVVASSNTSYTDQAPVDAQPYYAIEYVLSGAANAPAVNRAPKANISGRSNVVNRKDLEEGLEDIRVDSTAAQKVLLDGTLYIVMPEGKVYNATGVRVK